MITDDSIHLHPSHSLFELKPKDKFYYVEEKIEERQHSVEENSLFELKPPIIYLSETQMDKKDTAQCRRK